MKKIVTQKCITHYQAMCTNCDFTVADHTDPEYVRQLVYKHIHETNHKVKVIVKKDVAKRAADVWQARS